MRHTLPVWTADGSDTERPADLSRSYNFIVANLRLLQCKFTVLTVWNIVTLTGNSCTNIHKRFTVTSQSTTQVYGAPALQTANIW